MRGRTLIALGFAGVGLGNLLSAGATGLTAGPGWTAAVFGASGAAFLALAVREHRREGYESPSAFVEWGYRVGAVFVLVLGAVGVAVGTLGVLLALGAGALVAGP